MSEADAQLKIGADVSAFTEALNVAQEKLHSSMEAMHAPIEGVHKSLERLESGLRAIAVIAAGGIFRSLINEQLQEAAAVGGLAKTFGIAADEANTLNVALRLTGIAGEDFTAMAFKLLKNVQANEEGMKSLGLATRDHAGNLRPLMELTKDASAILMQYREGVDRDAAAQYLFGKSAQEAMAITKLNNDVMKRATELTQEYGIGIDGEGVDAAKKFKRAQAEIGLVLEFVTDKLGEQLLPVMVQFSHVLLDVVPPAAAATRIAIQAIGVGYYTLKQAVEGIITTFVSLYETIHAIVSLGADLLTFNGSIEESFKRFNQRILQIQKDNDAQLEASARTTADRIAALYLGAGESPKEEAPRKGGSKRFRAPEGDDPNKNKSRVGEWTAQLREAETKIAEIMASQGKFFELSVQQEIAYWQEKLKLTKAGTEENVAVRNRLGELEKKQMVESYEARQELMKAEEAAAQNNIAAKISIAQRELEVAAQFYGEQSKQALAAQAHLAEIRRQGVEQDRKLQDLRNESTRDVALADIDTQERATKTAYDLKAIELDQLLALETVYEDRRYAIRQDALKRELSLLDPNTDPVAYQQKLNEIEKLRIAHEAKMQEITLQGAKAEEGPLKSVLGAVGTSFEATVRNLTKGTVTIKDAFVGMAQSILTSVVDVFAKIAAQWAITQAMQLLGVTTTKIATVTSAASEAGANAVASTAAAPYPLNLTAPAVGAEMAAAALAYSAAGGFDIPAGVNPITQLHAREMVLPASIADPLREQLAGGGGGGDTHIHIHAVDAHSFKRMIETNRGAFLAMMKGAARGFAA